MPSNVGAPPCQHRVEAVLAGTDEEETREYEYHLERVRGAAPAVAAGEVVAGGDKHRHTEQRTHRAEEQPGGKQQATEKFSKRSHEAPEWVTKLNAH